MKEAITGVPVLMSEDEISMGERGRMG